MSIGKVIRKYRKEKNMTQEEMALRLGVTAPAVNKWENENSLPDIMLLAPIARLLGISPDTLLSFREELTQEEINGIIYELDEKLKTLSYEECFQWVKEKLEEYPNCEGLMLSTAVVLEAQIMLQEIPDAETYENYIVSLYERALQSGEEALRIRAADSLFAFYMRKEQYDRAVCFEMGRYHEISGGLELATMEKDADEVIRIMQEMFDAISQITGFRTSFLYEHMSFKEPRTEFVTEMRENLRQCFRDEETFGFLKGDERWERISAEG